jgi:hypothetical protein
MASHPFYLITTSVILAFSLVACGSSSTTRPTSTPLMMPGSSTTLAETTDSVPTQKGSASSKGSCMNAYFPLSSGATWSYTSTGSLVGDYSYTRTLSNLSNTGFTTSDAYGVLTHTVEWSCDSGNLTSLASGSSGTLVSGTSMKMTVDYVNATGYVIPRVFSDGTTWSEVLTVNGTNVQGTETKGTVVSEVSTDCTAAGADTLKVSAGTFDTVKIICHSNQVATVTLASGGTTGPITTIQDSTQWYAQGVGLVQTMNSGDAGSETIQLTGYSIP